MLRTCSQKTPPSASGSRDLEPLDLGIINEEELALATKEAKRDWLEAELKLCEVRLKLYKARVLNRKKKLMSADWDVDSHEPPQMLNCQIHL